MAETLLRQNRLGKARAKLPDEYHLAQFLQKIDNKHPSWTTNTPVCKWHNIECDANGEIFRINWTMLSLEGTPHWTHLSNIKCIFIFLNSNKLLEEIVLKWLPPNIRLFNGSGNKFGGGLNLNELPKQIESLQLDSCHLRGTISLHDLPHGFQSLQLGQNQLSGCLDFRALPVSINLLGFSYNNFSGPVDLHILPYYILLWLDNNPNLCGEFDPIRFERSINTYGTQIKKLPPRGSYSCFLSLRYVFDSDIWRF